MFLTSPLVRAVYSVDVHAIVSDAVKGSHVQRGPLSMGAQSEPGTGISKSKKRRDCAGSLCGRCNSASGLTLGGSVPMRERHTGKRPSHSDITRRKE